jgi:predicted DNA binding CopG/RHH family protein
MKAEYDFRSAKRGAIDPLPSGKTRITIALDDEILRWFKDAVNAAGGGNYQTLINNALRDHIRRAHEPLEDIVRRVVREELPRLRAGSDKPFEPTPRKRRRSTA